MGTIADLKRAVILIQENRSFSHYYGTLRGFADKSTTRDPVYPDTFTLTAWDTDVR